MARRMKAALGILALAVAGGLWTAWPDAPPAYTLEVLAVTDAPAAGPVAVTTAPLAPGAREWFTDVPPSAADRYAGPAAAQRKPYQVDPALEARQTAQLLAAYREETEARVPRLRADIERARAEGLEEAQIARLEAKLRRLEELRAMAGPAPLGGNAPAR